MNPAFAASLLPAAWVIPLTSSTFLRPLFDPNVAVLLILCGVLLLYAEFNRPGTIVLGCLGMLLTMLGVFGLSTLPLQPGALLAVLAGTGGPPALSSRVRRERVRLIVTTAGILVASWGLGNMVETQQARSIHPWVAVLAASIFGVVTGWLLEVAEQARRNKAIVPRTRDASQPGSEPS